MSSAAPPTTPSGVKPALDAPSRTQSDRLLAPRHSSTPSLPDDHRRPLPRLLWCVAVLTAFAAIGWLVAASQTGTGAGSAIEALAAAALSLASTAAGLRREIRRRASSSAQGRRPGS